MNEPASVELVGALTDPCPVCCLKPIRAMSLTSQDPDPSDGSVVICIGCGLVQIIRNGMRCALSEREADMAFGCEELLRQLWAVNKIRCMNPMRLAEMVREQREQQ